MEFRLLGDVELYNGSRRIDLGSARLRLLLAALLLENGHTVPFDTLVERVWEDGAPAKVASSVQANLSRLRRRLEEGGDTRVRLEYVPLGYRLRVPAECIDAQRFVHAISQGLAAVHRGDHDEAIRLLRDGESLMRGEPLTGLPGAWAKAARTGLQERHRSAVLARIGLELDQGDPGPLIGELRQLGEQYPLDEKIAALSMKALHAAGRTADALALFMTIAQRLRRELGIGPHQALRQQHQAILQDERHTTPVQPTAPPPAAFAPDTLERDAPGFIGRQQEVEDLTREILHTLSLGQIALYVIDGMPGSGKSTLAVHVAHLLREHCPDGALQIHLRGHDTDARPTTATTALAILLGMLDVDPAAWQHSPSLDHMLALWRRHTSNRRLLLLYDDATSADQIRHLLPNGSGSIVLVTSRHQLIELTDALRHTLVPLPRPDALRLFRHAARSTEDDQALQAAVEACGRLPLALTVAGSALRLRPAWKASDLAAHLMRALVSEHTDAISRRLHLAFETSYRDLPPPVRLLFRRLSLYPFGYISLYAAAALADIGLHEADRTLTVLTEQHLLSEPRRFHYRLHDLTRSYASFVAERDDPALERQAAVSRLVQMVATSVDRATAQFHPHRHVNLLGQSAPTFVNAATFTTSAEAATWLDQEQGTLRALAQLWYSHGHPHEAAAISHMMSMYLDRRSLWRESLPLHESAHRTWTRSGSTLGQAHALTDLTTVHGRLGDFDQARLHAQAALAIWQELQDTSGEAEVLLQLGRILRRTHDLPAAAEHYRRSAALRSALGDTHGTAVATYHLGIANVESGNYDEGIAHTRTALDLARRIHDVAVERNILNNLGDFLARRGEVADALAYFQQALDIAREVGDPRNTALAMLNVGEANVLLGNADAASTSLEPALVAFRALKDRHGEISTLLGLSAFHLLQTDTERCADFLHEAEAKSAELNDPLLRVQLGFMHARLNTALGDLQAAIAYYGKALAECQQSGAPHLEAQLSTAMAAILAETHQMGQARQLWRRALEIYREIGSPEASVLHEMLRES